MNEQNTYTDGDQSWLFWQTNRVIIERDKQIAILKAERDELRAALAEVLALDDGDVPAFWDERARTAFDRARALLDRIKGE